MNSNPETLKEHLSENQHVIDNNLSKSDVHASTNINQINNDVNWQNQMDEINGIGPNQEQMHGQDS